MFDQIIEHIKLGACVVVLLKNFSLFLIHGDDDDDNDLFLPFFSYFLFFFLYSTGLSFMTIVGDLSRPEQDD